MHLVRATQEPRQIFNINRRSSGHCSPISRQSVSTEPLVLSRSLPVVNRPMPLLARAVSVLPLFQKKKKALQFSPRCLCLTTSSLHCASNCFSCHFRRKEPCKSFRTPLRRRRPRHHPLVLPDPLVLALLWSTLSVICNVLQLNFVFHEHAVHQFCIFNLTERLAILSASSRQGVQINSSTQEPHQNSNTHTPKRTTICNRQHEKVAQSKSNSVLANKRNIHHRRSRKIPEPES